MMLATGKGKREGRAASRRFQGLIALEGGGKGREGGGGEDPSDKPLHVCAGYYG